MSFLPSGESIICWMFSTEISIFFSSEESPAEPEMVRTVTWRELYDTVDPEIEDRSYWTKLNKKLDKVLKGMEKKK